MSTPDYTVSRMGDKHEFAILKRVVDEHAAKHTGRPIDTHAAVCLYCPAIPEPPLGPWEPDNLSLTQEMLQSSVFLWTWSEVTEHLAMHKIFGHTPDPTYHPKGWRSTRPQDLQSAMPPSGSPSDFHLEP